MAGRWGLFASALQMLFWISTMRACLTGSGTVRSVSDPCPTRNSGGVGLTKGTIAIGREGAFDVGRRDGSCFWSWLTCSLVSRLAPGNTSSCSYRDTAGGRARGVSVD